MYIQSDVIDEIKLIKPAFFKNAFEKLFTWQELENLLNLRPFVNDDRCKMINQKKYTWELQSWLTDVNTYPPSLLDAEIRQNHCYLQDASRANKKINAVCEQLESIFPRGSADAHIYFNISENDSSGFGIHWDGSHNLIVQMEGETQFQIWDDNIIGDRIVQFLNEEPIIDVVLQSGDAVFVPMNTYHRATSKTKRFSISFPISMNDVTANQDRHWIKIT